MDPQVCPVCRNRSLVKPISIVLSQSNTGNIQGGGCTSGCLAFGFSGRTQNSSRLALLLAPPSNQSGPVVITAFVIWVLINIGAQSQLVFWFTGVLFAVVATLATVALSRVQRDQLVRYEELWYCPVCGIGVSHARQATMPVNNFSALWRH